MSYSWKPIPEYGDLFTLEEFLELCESYCFVDYDGFGNYSDGENMVIGLDMMMLPSEFLAIGRDTVFTHVVWFNK